MNVLPEPSDEAAIRALIRRAQGFRDMTIDACRTEDAEGFQCSGS